jgi:hypothetical protein
MPQSLKACPGCGKQAGVLIRRENLALPVSGHVRRVRVDDRTTKLEAVAAKLWNEAKREGKARARERRK